MKHDLSCATLRKGVFAAGAALTLLSMLTAILYYWAHSKADTGFWEKHRNEGLGLATQHHHHQGPDSDKAWMVISWFGLIYSILVVLFLLLDKGVLGDKGLGRNSVFKTLFLY